MLQWSNMRIYIWCTNIFNSWINHWYVHHGILDFPHRIIPHLALFLVNLNIVLHVIVGGDLQQLLHCYRQPVTTHHHCSPSITTHYCHRHHCHPANLLYSFSFFPKIPSPFQRIRNLNIISKN